MGQPDESGFPTQSPHLISNSLPLIRRRRKEVPKFPFRYSLSLLISLCICFHALIKIHFFPLIVHLSHFYFMGLSFPPFNSSCVVSSSQMGFSFFCNWDLGVLVSGMGSASAHCPPGISPLVREKSYLSPPRSDFLMIFNPSSKRRCLKLSLYPASHAFISSLKVLKCYWILFSICIRVFPLIDENVNVILCVTTISWFNV